MNKEASMLTLLKNGEMTMVISSLGAEPQSLKLGDREYLWQGDREYWFRRAPLLFPMIGPTKDNQIGAKGKVYDMPNNGFARDTEFDLLFTDGQRAVYLLQDTPESREKYYPFGFALTVTYTLLEDGYEAKAEIRAKEDLWYTFGWHPAFSLDINGKGTELDTYRINFQVDEKLDRKYAVDGAFRWDRGFVDGDFFDVTRTETDKGAIILDGVRSQEVVLSSCQGPHGVRATMGDMDTLTVWTCMPKHGQYVCVEPMVSFGDVNRKFDIEEMEETRLLQAGKTRTYVNTFRVF